MNMFEMDDSLFSAIRFFQFSVHYSYLGFECRNTYVHVRSFDFI